MTSRFSGFFQGLGEILCWPEHAPQPKWPRISIRDFLDSSELAAWQDHDVSRTFLDDVNTLFQDPELYMRALGVGQLLRYTMHFASLPERGRLIQRKLKHAIEGLPPSLKVKLRDQALYELDETRDAFACLTAEAHPWDACERRDGLESVARVLKLSEGPLLEFELMRHDATMRMHYRQHAVHARHTYPAHPEAAPFRLRLAKKVTPHIWWV